MACSVTCWLRWYLYLPVFAVWAFAYARMFVDPTPRLPLLFNWTPSLPYHVAWMQSGAAPLQRGDLVVFRFEGAAQTRYPGLRGQPFFKRVCGLPGDVVTVQDRIVQVNGASVGIAKTHAVRSPPAGADRAAGDPGRSLLRAGHGARTASIRATATAGWCGRSRCWVSWCRCSEEDQTMQERPSRAEHPGGHRTCRAVAKRRHSGCLHG